jgi:hypothetical protein
MLVRKLTLDSNAISKSAQVLRDREPENPFFAYLAEGQSAHVTNLVLAKCPSPDRPSRKLFQWSWERTDGEQAWRDSMYWDCIFMGQLLTAH